MTELDLIVKLLQLSKPFTLKPYQSDARLCIENKISRLSDLLILPTGTGKTVIFTIAICDHIIKYNKDIIIVTKRKDILAQMPERIKSYIDSFISNKLIKPFEYKIVNCLDSCSTKRLNKNSSVPRIYIVNWDKFTSSSNTDYKQINWNKFGLLILDESHWVGSTSIHEIMMYIKDKTTLNYLGFSATPIRLNPTNQSNTLDIFGSGQDFNILYEYSYYLALTNKDICPIKYCICDIGLDDLEPNINNEEDIEANQEEADNKEENINYHMVLSEKSYKKVWTQINDTIISKTNFKKGIFWFCSRIQLLKFYIWAKVNSNIKNFNFIPTMSNSSNENKNITKLILDSKLKPSDFNSGIETFLSNTIETNTNTILLSVGRAIEGLDHDRLEFGVKMYWTEGNSFLIESQRMGRFTRWYKNDPNEIKQVGYYGSLEISNSIEIIKKSLIQRLKSWIAFSRTYSTFSHGEKKHIDKEQKEKEILELIQMYVDVETLRIYQIDINTDILAMLNVKEYDKYKIKNAIINANKKYSPNEKINTKSKYDIWAFQNDFPICDDLEDFGFNDFKWLFSMDLNDYLSWIELKKLCKQYQLTNPKLSPAKIYDLMIVNNVKVPDISMLNQLYKEYNSLRNLFSINL
jgi:superfamily II DNA or RNA helicase